jgi:NAD(P)-dependent dehydrogenase (short-subunit alcohol dehydrogenase family)
MNTPPSRTVLVTGASSGIGRDIALDLAGRGFAVFASVRTEAAAADLAKETAGRVTPLRFDVRDEAAVAAARVELLDRTGGAGLDGLVNNAGVVVAAPLEAIPLAAFEDQLAVNVVGPLRLTQAFLADLRRARGRVVNMGSISGRVSFPFVGSYAASKAALRAWTDSLRLELASAGVAVSLVEPGNVRTPIWERSERAAVALGEQFSADHLGYYETALRRFQDKVRQAGERSPDSRRVVAAVRHALTARRPKAHYLVGGDARLGVWLDRLLPVRLLDHIRRRLAGVS